MGRYAQYPTLYDECKTIEISLLKKWGYLKPGYTKAGTLKWSRNGVNTGSISFTIDYTSPIGKMTLDYKCNGKPIKYEVLIIARESNLGKGEIVYFGCPSTRKLCRKLYLVETYFLHRDAFKGCCYDCQTQSHRIRDLRKAIDKEFSTERLYEQLYKPYFKQTYKGKPTKKMLKIKRKLKS